MYCLHNSKHFLHTNNLEITKRTSMKVNLSSLNATKSSSIQKQISLTKQ